MSEPGSQPTEEELREAYEAELSRITVDDMLLQTVVSLLNIGARRLGLAGEGQGAPGTQLDLEQVGDAIDGVRALLPILERRHPENLRPLRDALSQLQMAYARQTQAAGEREQAAPQPAAEGTQTPPSASPDQANGASEQSGPGPAEASGRLWVPGS
ncbi:MAG TPA: hypothetical protein VIC05_13400 [Solirubrobacteraceae bacterium]|jgi:hypothetical protein